MQVLAANPQSGVAHAPHWGWYVILYFFLGGMTGGMMAIASGLQWIGERRDEDAVRLVHRLAFPLILCCAVLLILDLGRPERFWHMVVMSERLPRPIIKAWSPISLGTWIVSLFGLVAFVEFLGTVPRTAPWLRRPWPLGAQRVWLAVAALAGLALAGYTGVLVTGTSLPVWHNARLMGALFLISGTSTAYALLTLLLMARGRAPHDPTVRKLGEGDRWAVAFELVVLIITLIALGGLGRPFWSGGFGVVLGLGVIGIGLLVPLALHWVGADRAVRVSAACVLVGGLLLRFVIVMSPQYPTVPIWKL